MCSEIKPYGTCLIMAIALARELEKKGVSLDESLKIVRALLPSFNGNGSATNTLRQHKDALVMLYGTEYAGEYPSVARTVIDSLPGGEGQLATLKDVKSLDDLVDVLALVQRERAVDVVVDLDAEQVDHRSLVRHVPRR